MNTRNSITQPPPAGHATARAAAPEPDSPQTTRQRHRRPRLPSAGNSGSSGQFAAFVVAPRLELEVHVVGSTGVGSDGRAAGGSRWEVSGWQLVERRPGTVRVLAGQQGSFSAMAAALEALRHETNVEKLAESLLAAGVPRFAKESGHG